MIGLRSIKDNLVKWAETAWNNITTDSIIKGWKKIKIEICWESSFMCEAEQKQKELTGEDHQVDSIIFSEEDSFVTEDIENVNFEIV
jgi:hypothetical protein